MVLGFVGGIISWLKQKDVNRHKALNILTLGILVSLIWTIPFFVIGDLQAPPNPGIPTWVAIFVHIGLVLLVGSIVVWILIYKSKNEL